MNCNQVSLDGHLSSGEGLRYTPAGIPVLGFRLSHTSEQSEAGMRRTVQCEVRCTALGEAALKISALPEGARLRIQGFLARRSRNSTQLVLHVNTFELEK